MTEIVEMPSFRRHTHEKLANAVTMLATHPGDARARICVALNSLLHIQKRSLTTAERARLDKIIRRATRCGALRSPYDRNIVLRSAAENTAARTHNSTAAQIAADLWDFYWEFSRRNVYTYEPT